MDKYGTSNDISASDVLTFIFFMSSWVQTGYNSSLLNADLSAATCSDLQAPRASASVYDSEGWRDTVRHIQSLRRLNLEAERCVASWDMKWGGGRRRRAERSVRKKETDKVRRMYLTWKEDQDFTPAGVQVGKRIRSILSQKYSSGVLLSKAP